MYMQYIIIYYYIPSPPPLFYRIDVKVADRRKRVAAAIVRALCPTNDCNTTKSDQKMYTRALDSITRMMSKTFIFLTKSYYET